MIEFSLVVTLIILVVLIGYLISLGNERQRRELGLLRQEVEGWALEDLAIKRAHLEQHVAVADPKQWLGRIGEVAFNRLPQIEHVECLHNPDALLAYCGGERLVFSLTPPAALPKTSWFQRGAGRLAGASAHPLAERSRKDCFVEVSALNGGYAFDLELADVWKQLAGQTTRAKRMWVYLLPEASQGRAAR